MLTCIYISEQVLCQQVQNLSIVSTTIFTTTKSTCTLFEKARTGCSKHKRAIWLKFSYPKSPPHPKLVIPKHSSEGHSGICPLSLSTHEAGAAYYLLCFSQNTYKVLGTHELLTHIYWRFKKKKFKKLKKPHKTNPKSLLKRCQLDKAHWFQQVQAGRSRSVTDWHCACACQESKLWQPCLQSYKPPRPVSFKGVSWYSMCYYSLQN